MSKFRDIFLNFEDIQQPADTKDYDSQDTEQAKQEILDADLDFSDINLDLNLIDNQNRTPQPIDVPDAPGKDYVDVLNSLIEQYKVYLVSSKHTLPYIPVDLYIPLSAVENPASVYDRAFVTTYDKYNKDKTGIQWIVYRGLPLYLPTDNPSYGLTFSNTGVLFGQDHTLEALIMDTYHIPVTGSIVAYGYTYRKVNSLNRTQVGNDTVIYQVSLRNADDGIDETCFDQDKLIEYIFDPELRVALPKPWYTVLQYYRICMDTLLDKLESLLRSATNQELFSPGRNPNKLFGLPFEIDAETRALNPIPLLALDYSISRRLTNIRSRYNKIFELPQIYYDTIGYKQIKRNYHTTLIVKDFLDNYPYRNALLYVLIYVAYEYFKPYRNIPEQLSEITIENDNLPYVDTTNNVVQYMNNWYQPDTTTRQIVKLYAYKIINDAKFDNHLWDDTTLNSIITELQTVFNDPYNTNCNALSNVLCKLVCSVLQNTKEPENIAVSIDEFKDYVEQYNQETEGVRGLLPRLYGCIVLSIMIDNVLLYSVFAEGV